MNSVYESDDEEYAAISVNYGVSSLAAYVDDLRRLARSGHVESMNLLAVLLGDMDSAKHREEIISLYERAHELGSTAAAENLSIQYRQWNEPVLSKYWGVKASKLNAGGEEE